MATANEALEIERKNWETQLKEIEDNLIVLTEEFSAKKLLLSQDGLDMLGKFTVNSWREGDQFDFFDKQQFDQDTYNRWYETAVVTAMATAPLAGIGGGISMIQQANLEKASAKKIATFSVYARTPKLRKAYQTQQEQLFAENKISEKQLKLNLETLNNVSGILESLPDNLSSKAQKTVLQLELEISDLKKQKTENGPASSAINEEIKNRELAIEQVVKEDQAAGGMKAELLQKKVVASQAIKNIQEQTLKFKNEFKSKHSFF